MAKRRNASQPPPSFEFVEGWPSVTVACSGETHRIVMHHRGALRFLDHPRDEVRAWRVAENLGAAQMCGCHAFRALMGVGVTTTRPRDELPAPAPEARMLREARRLRGQRMLRQRLRRAAAQTEAMRRRYRCEAMALRILRHWSAPIRWDHYRTIVDVPLPRTRWVPVRDASLIAKVALELTSGGRRIKRARISLGERWWEWARVGLAVVDGVLLHRLACPTIPKSPAGIGDGFCGGAYRRGRRMVDYDVAPCCVRSDGARWRLWWL